jgi:hypothetical protein
LWVATPRRLDIAFTRREHERRQPASAGSHQPGHDDLVVVLIVGIGVCIRCRPLGTCPTLTSGCGCRLAR